MGNGVAEITSTPPHPHPFAASNGRDKYRAGGRSRHSPGKVRQPAGTCCWTGAERFPAGRDGMGQGETPTCWRVAGQSGLPEGVAAAAGTGAVWSCPLPRPVPPPQQLFSALSLLHFIMDLTKVPPPPLRPPAGLPAPRPAVVPPRPPAPLSRTGPGDISRPTGRPPSPSSPTPPSPCRRRRLAQPPSRTVTSFLPGAAIKPPPPRPQGARCCRARPSRRAAPHGRPAHGKCPPRPPTPARHPMSPGTGAEA